MKVSLLYGTVFDTFPSSFETFFYTFSSTIGWPFCNTFLPSSCDVFVTLFFQMYPGERHSLRHLDASEHFETTLLSFLKDNLWSASTITTLTTTTARKYSLDQTESTKSVQRNINRPIMIKYSYSSEPPLCDATVRLFLAWDCDDCVTSYNWGCH